MSKVATAAAWRRRFRDHQSPAGACARVTRARPPSGQLGVAVGAFKTDVLPLLEPAAGFCSAIMHINRGPCCPARH